MSSVIVMAVFRQLESFLENSSSGVKCFLLASVMKGNKVLLLSESIHFSYLVVNYNTPLPIFEILKHGSEKYLISLFRYRQIIVFSPFLALFLTAL